MPGFFEYRDNAEAVVRDVEAMRARMVRTEPLLERFGARMSQYSVPQNFAEGGRPTRWPDTPRGGQAMVDTGRLRNSITHEVRGRSVRVGTNVKYAALRHFGGTIVGRDKALAIPVEVSQSRRRPKHYPNLQWRPTRNRRFVGMLGEELAVRTRGANGRYKKSGSGRWVTRFLLARQVVQPARPFLMFQADDLAWMERETVQHILEGRR